MASPSEYRDQISSLGLNHLSETISNSTEAKATLRCITALQKEIRQIKRNINLDMKMIRAEYRERSSNAAATSSAVFSLLGKRKVAGQLRADEKRRLSQERDNILRPYEGVKLTIDDLLVQMDGVKGRLKSYIEQAKAEAQAQKAEIAKQKANKSRISNAKFCPDCGLKISRSAKFCSECGHRF